MGRDHSSSKVDGVNEADMRINQRERREHASVPNRSMSRHRRTLRDDDNEIENQHNLSTRRPSRKTRKLTATEARKRDEDLIHELLPSSSMDSGTGRKATVLKGKARSDTPKKERHPTKVTAELSQHSDDKTDDKVESLTYNSKDKPPGAFQPDSSAPAPTIPNLIKIPIKVLAILVEIHLLWWFLQMFIFVWMTTRVDWKLRVRTPIEEFPGYSAPRMPWLPGQIGMRNRLLAAWLTLAFLYLPAVLYHTATFFYQPNKEKERILVTRLSEPKPWFKDERYTQLYEPKSQQLLTFSLLVLAIILWVFYIFVFLSDTFFPMQDSYWKRVINSWLYDLQRYYFLQYKGLSRFIEPQYAIPSYHTPDDGSKDLLIIDLLQSMFECCGRTQGYKDWNSPHVYRPKNQTFRKAMGIPILYERAHYLVPTLTNESVPFSCCRWRHKTAVMAPVDCDHMLVQDKSTLFDRGCVEPLTEFIQNYWMQTHLVPLLLVILTMIPQIFLFLVTVQPKELKEQATETIENIENCLTFKYRELQMIGRNMLSVLSKSSSQARSSNYLPFGMLDFDDLDDDFYKVVREEVAVSEREIYDKGKDKTKRHDSKVKRDATEKKKLQSNIKPSPHLQNRKSPVEIDSLNQDK